MLFKKKKPLVVQEQTINMYEVGGEDYICLTDMVRGEEGSDHIKNWMRNRNTIEFLGLWEAMYNPDFKGVEFDTFRQDAGLNSFTMTPRKWIEATNAKGIISRSGRTGGTYAHKDIAFEFGTWISSAFKLYLIKDYQQAKDIENNPYNIQWNAQRFLSKVNYQLHTDAVKDYVIPVSKKWRKAMEYAEEADILNIVVFGCTAKEWQAANPKSHKAGHNLRDSASINELIVISNIESRNAQMMREGIARKTRFEELQRLASWQLGSLKKSNFMKSIKKTSDKTFLIEGKKLEN